METVSPDTVLHQLSALIEEEIPAAIELRHDIHRHPTISGEEGPTADRIIAAIGTDDYEVVAETGRIVRIGPKDGPAIAVRAELDALPVKEATGATFTSTNEYMHACGHDVHMAGAVALARAAMKMELPVAIVFIFQPREESYPSGARDVVESRALEAHDIRAVFAVHVHPGVARGAVATGVGVVNAACDVFEIEVEGTGGHSAYPHRTADPIVAMAQVVTAAQTIVSRRIDPMNPAVLSFGSLLSGQAANVIPTRAIATGSIRSTTKDDRKEIARELEHIVNLVAESNRCVGRLSITDGEPLLRNDAALVAHTDPALIEKGFDVVEPMRSCGSDDFSYFGDTYPGVMMFLGTGAHRDDLTLHSPDFLPPDESVRDVARVLAAAYRAGVDHIG